MIRFENTIFLKSAEKVNQLPDDVGIEVAFAGRSNAGKSSALNTLTGQKQLARVSKTPGRTRLMNCFMLDNNPNHRIIDLPGYGYAKVSQEMQAKWQRHLTHYFEVRESLKLVVLLMDIRHPLSKLDESMVKWALKSKLNLHVVLTKADKLSKSKQKATCMMVERQYENDSHFSVQTLSSLKRIGINELKQILNAKFALD